MKKSYRVYLKVDKRWVQVVISDDMISTRIFGTEEERCNVDEFCVYEGEIELEKDFDAFLGERKEEKNLIKWELNGDPATFPNL